MIDSERVAPPCSRGCPAARCYWRVEAGRRWLASAPPCLQQPPWSQTTQCHITQQGLWKSRGTRTKEHKCVRALGFVSGTANITDAMWSMNRLINGKQIHSNTQDVTVFWQNPCCLGWSLTQKDSETAQTGTTCDAVVSASYSSVKQVRTD